MQAVTRSQGLARLSAGTRPCLLQPCKLARRALRHKQLQQHRASERDSGMSVAVDHEIESAYSAQVSTYRVVQT